MASTPDQTPRVAARDVAVQIGGRLLNLALGLVVAALIVRALGDTGFGRWATVLTVVEISVYFTALGLDTVAVRLAAADPERAEGWVGALTTLKLAIALPVALVAGGIVLLLADGTEMRTAGLILCVALLFTPANALRLVFSLRLRNDVPIAVMTVNSVAWTASVAVLGAAGAGLVPFAIAFISASALAALLIVAAAVRVSRVPLRASRRLWPELLRVGVPVGIAGALVTAYARIDQILVYELAGPRDAGLYGSVYRILEQAHFLPISLLTTLAPLTAAAAASDPARLRRLVGVGARYLAIASLGGLAVSLFCARPLVVAVYGRKFAEAADALPVLAGAYVLISFGYLVGNLVLLFGLQKIFVGVAAAALVVNVALNVVFVPRYGFLAAAWATLITELVAVVPMGVLALRRLGERPGFGPTVRVVAAAAGLAAGGSALRAAGAPLGVLLLAAGPLYAGLLFGLRVLRAGELRALLRREIA